MIDATRVARADVDDIFKSIFALYKSNGTIPSSTAWDPVVNNNRYLKSTANRMMSVKSIKAAIRKPRPKVRLNVSSGKLVKG